MVLPTIPRCPQCGAPLTRIGGEWSRRCGFCHADLTVGMPAVPAPSPVAPPAAPAAHPPSSSRSGPMIIVSLAFGMPVIISLVVLVIVKASDSSNPASSPFAGTDDFQWDSSERVLVTPVPGQTHEGFIGRVRRYADGGHDGPALMHVGLFSGATYERIWLSPSLGRASEDSAYQAVHVAAANGRVVYTDARNAAHLVDLATGRATANVQLSDRALSVCASAAGPVWIEVSDQHNVLLDPVSGRATFGEVPADCHPTMGPGSMNSCGSGNARPSALCVDAQSNAIAGMNLQAMVAVGDGSFVAMGTRQPGTAVPTVAAMNASGVVTWIRPLPAVEVAQAEERAVGAFDVVGGGIFAAYKRRDNVMRVVAIDAATGRTRWESSTPRADGSGADTVTVGRERVYVPHWTWLDVFDRTTGAHLHTVGRW